MTVMRSYDFNAVIDGNCLVARPSAVETLWVNITRRCNQTCAHCHVGAAPWRTEEMDRRTIDQCLKVLGSIDSCGNLDITGGAPELHSDFEYLVVAARKLGKHVIVRHNLTVDRDAKSDHGFETDLPSFFAENDVEILASLPYYERDITDSIRGEGVFDKSIEGLKRLNAHGYGRPNTGLDLNLVCNRDGAVSSQDVVSLEASFRQELWEEFGVVFNRLIAVTNMPINRYFLRLKESAAFSEYMDGLVSSFNRTSIDNLVCRSVISVGYDGRLYDCDFNQMLGMTAGAASATTVFNFDLQAWLQRQIRFGPHCFGCTAGGGSS